MSNCKDCGREEWGFLSSLDDDGYCYSCAAKHNKEKIERLQKQLEEANRVIKRELRRQSPKGGVLLCDMNDYLKKWGVK